MNLRILACAVGVLAVSAIAAPASAQFAGRVIGLNTGTSTGNASGGTNAAQLENIDEGEALLGGTAGFNSRGSALTSTAVINFARGGDADFAGGVNFPDVSAGALDQDDFAVDFLAKLTINTTGNYVFRVNTDDGFRVRTGVTSTGAGGTTYSEFVAPRGPGNTDGPSVPLAAGTPINTRVTFFERGGGEEIEVSYSLNSGAFQLVGSTGDITVSPIPEPTGLGLLAVAGLALLRRRRTA